MAAWTCPRCRTVHPRTTQVCRTIVNGDKVCGGVRPKRRTPKHQLVLELVPYETWVELYGERCGICGRPPGPNRKLHRDHDHQSGKSRGLLCHRCNRALPYWVTIDWMFKALVYLLRAKQRAHKTSPTSDQVLGQGGTDGL